MHISYRLWRSIDKINNIVRHGQVKYISVINEFHLFTSICPEP